MYYLICNSTIAIGQGHRSSPFLMRRNKGTKQLTAALWGLLCSGQYSVLRCMYYLPLVLVSDSQGCLELKQDTVFYGKCFVNCVVYLLLIFSVSIESHLEVLQLCSQKYLQVTIWELNKKNSSWNIDPPFPFEMRFIQLIYIYYNFN